MCNKGFPSVLWDKIIRQLQDSLNMLQTSRVHPQLSAFHVLEGHHDFNRVPFGPPGTRGTIFNPPEVRTSWGPRALDAWYLGPSWDHYRCLTFQIPSTGGIRTSAQYKLYPQHAKVPQETPMDKAVHIAHKLTNAIQQLLNEPTTREGRHVRALEKLADIFSTATKNLENRHTLTTPTSTTPTTPANIRTTPRVHQRVTRNNTPGIIPNQNATIAISEGEQISEGEKQNRERSTTTKHHNAPLVRQAPPESARDARMAKRQQARKTMQTEPRPAIPAINQKCHTKNQKSHRDQPKHRCLKKYQRRKEAQFLHSECHGSLAKRL